MKKEKNNKKAEPQIKVVTLVLTGVVLALVLVGALVGYTYDSVLDGRPQAGLAKFKLFALPAVIVNGGETISFNQVQKNLAAMRKFYETQDYSQVGLRVDFSTPDGQKRLLIKEKELLNKMIEDRFVQLLAKENGVVVAQADIDASVQAKLDEYGNKEAVEKDLEAHYGWNMEDFKTQIVTPAVYREQLAQKVATLNEGENVKLKEKIQKAQQELVSGADFATVAKKYSEGSTASEGGELGWVSGMQLAPELAAALFGPKPSEKFAIIESSLGYHIMEVEEKKKEGNEDVLRVRQIFVRKKTFTTWLDEQIKTRKVQVLLKNFTWNKNGAKVEFSREELKKFEQETKEQTQGDASLLF